MFLSAQPTTLSPTFQFDASGNLYWYKWVCIWLDTTNQQIKESEKYITASNSTPATLLASIPSFATMEGGGSTINITRVLAGTGTKTNEGSVNVTALAFNTTVVTNPISGSSVNALAYNMTISKKASVASTSGTNGQATGVTVGGTVGLRD